MDQHGIHISSLFGQPIVGCTQLPVVNHYASSGTGCLGGGASTLPMQSSRDQSHNYYTQKIWLAQPRHTYNTCLSSQGENMFVEFNPKCLLIHLQSTCLSFQLLIRQPQLLLDCTVNVETWFIFSPMKQAIFDEIRDNVYGLKYLLTILKDYQYQYFWNRLFNLIGIAL